MPGRHYHIVFNPNSGTALATGLTAAVLCEKFTSKGYDASIDDNDKLPLEDRIKLALNTESEIIVAAGGDGTITALAAALVDKSKTLALLPLGTANLLARDLAIPLDLDQAIVALESMEPKRIDVGEVNGRVFLHNVTIGFITGIAKAREQIRGRSDPGALLGFAAHFFRRLQRARRIAVEITSANSAPRAVRLHALTIANNSYDQGIGQVFTRQSLSDGHLAMYTLRHLTIGDFFRLSASMLLGRWQQEDAVDIEEVTAVTIRTKKDRITAMMDGEIETLDVPLSFRIRPRVLSVLAPVPAAEAVEEPDQPEFAVGI